MDTATLPPPRRTDLIIRPLGDQGQHVVKDPISGNYYNLGEPEVFLLEALDGSKSAGEICAAFEARFKDSLTPSDLDEFLELAKGMGFLRSAETITASDTPGVNGQAATTQAPPKKKSRQSILYWRANAFDPDRLFNWLEPKIQFFWTKAFLVGSLTAIVLAWWVFLNNWYEMFSNIRITWETAVMAWLTIAFVTTLHEFAHGLTCKHYGGEVHEIGFLLMFFMPCFYCNVSDAWLMRERWKRLWVTLAGGYLDLCIWALAIFTWRLTIPGTLVNYLALVVSSVCGVRIFFNFNPLLKLDGYYLLSDWTEMPNLRQRALDYVSAHLRWLLWGDKWPSREQRGVFLFWYGVTCWCFSAFFLTVMLLTMGKWVGDLYGIAGVAFVVCFGTYLARGMFSGISGGQIMKMLQFRHKRTAIWGGIILVVLLAMVLIRVDDRATGNFKVRPASRAELRAPIGCFLKSVHCDEGGKVTSGSLVAIMEIPDLLSKLSQKKSEVAEAEAKLRILEVGTRKEELIEAREKVTRAKGWCDLAKEDLKRKQTAMQEEINRLNQTISKCELELENSQNALTQAKRLLERKAINLDQVREIETQMQVSVAAVNQARASKRERMALGTLDTEAELARREKEFADAQAALNLMEAGVRQEEKEAQRAHLARLKEEVSYLQQLGDRLKLTSTVSGVITTSRFREKIGQFFKEGDLICEVESPTELDAEIMLLEQEVTRVQVGQHVTLKVRALPFDVFHGKVNRIAPAAVKTEKDIQATVTINCRIEDANENLRPNMTGYARVYGNSRALGGYLFDRVLRYFRTEFWW